MEVILILIGCAICGAIGRYIGQFKGRADAGMWLGVLLGPIGWLLAALVLHFETQCPHCCSPIHPQARVCPRCQRAQFVARGPFVSEQDLQEQADRLRTSRPAQ